MSDQAYQYLAIGIYFLGMVGIGLYASTKNKNTEDYMLGGRSLRPSVAALSAGASDMSGWLVMGLPGTIYMAGLLDAWASAHGHDLPIVRVVARVCAGELDPAQGVEVLMGRGAKEER